MQSSLSAFVFLLSFLCSSHIQAKRLFLLSGQSNMQGHRPQEAFIPIIEDAYGKENVIILQHAIGGKPIHRWWKGWKTPDGKKPEESGDIYDDLLNKTLPLTEGKKLKSVCFVWMQGERDAKMGWGDLYEDALIGLHTQLTEDLQWKPEQLIFVIGRLSDFDLENKKYPHWTMVRDIQSKVTASKENWHLVNTDDLNDGINRKGKKISNDLHYSAKGYKILGQRFAQTCIEAISKAKQP